MFVLNFIYFSINLFTFSQPLYCSLTLAIFPSPSVFSDVPWDGPLVFPSPGPPMGILMGRPMRRPMGIPTGRPMEFRWDDP